MDREILYRGKAINREGRMYRSNYNNGDWVYGLVTRLYDERFERLSAEMTDINGIIGIEVDYKTIGQYTGLTDKNGTKIFEGDIVSTGNSDDYLGVVEWEKDNAGLAVSFDGLFEKFEEINFVDKVKLEVIGNIHDNPELIKQED